MFTNRASKKPPMQSFARMIARPGQPDETLFELPSRAVCVGDPVTDQGGRVELGVTSAAMFVLDVGVGEDTEAIVIRARPTVAVRWELGATGGVDSGVFGVWDADTRMTGSGGKADLGGGAGWIRGRRVFALETGDGGFPCVVGFDDKGEVCAVVAGPGVDPVRFGAVLREEHMTEAERAEKAAKDARDAALAQNDLLGAALGEKRASPPLRWFVAGWLESLPEAERAAARQRLEPVLEQLALPKSAKKARERTKADMIAILAWALSGWATVLAATLPEQASLLEVKGSIDKDEMQWAGVLGLVFDQRMTAHRYDLTRPYQAELALGEWEAWYSHRRDIVTAMGTALRDVPADLSSRFGFAGLRAVTEKVKLHHQLEEALWYAARGLEWSLELFILATRTADLGPVTEGAPRGGLRLRPRDPGYVEDLLAKVETAADFLLRLAARA